MIFHILLFLFVLNKLITLVVIATAKLATFSWFLQLPSSGAAYQTRLEQLLKYPVGGMGGPYNQLHLWVTSLNTNQKISSVE